MSNYAPTDQKLHSDVLVRTNRHDIDAEALAQHWKLTSQIRINQIQKFGLTEKLTSVLSEYSAYKRTDVLMLVILIKIFQKSEKKTFSLIKNIEYN